MINEHGVSFKNKGEGRGKGLRRGGVNYFLLSSPEKGGGAYLKGGLNMGFTLYGKYPSP